MTYTNQNAKIYRGDTAVLEIDLLTADGLPYDPESDVGIKYRISRNSSSPEAEAFVRKTVGSGLVINGTVAEVSLSATDTDLEPGLYYHELKVSDDPDVATAMTGTVVIKSALKMA